MFLFAKIKLNLSMWQIKSLLVCGSFFAFWCTEISGQILFAPIVTTACGNVMGGLSMSRGGKTFYQYLGIRYAQPPIGDKRFELPEPPQPFAGIQLATFFGQKCLQKSILGGTVVGDEDCLFLNVFAPKDKGTEKLPVLVFLHGGSFNSGGSNDYDASYFMDEKLVLVTLNYRLDSLGFLSTGDGVVRGNMGLQDQSMAFEWIKKNIAAFGGDPARFTLWGHSAGATCTHFHVLSPRSKGLIAKAITESGSPLVSWSINRDPANQARTFAAKLGCPVNDTKIMVACLKKIDGKKMIDTKSDMVPITDVTAFVPTIETLIDGKTFMSEEPADLLREGRFTKVPMMSGVNSEEGLLQSAAIIGNQTELNEANNDWTPWVSKMLLIPENEDLAKETRKFYFGDVENIASKNLHREYTNMFSGRNFFKPIHCHAESYAKHAPIWLYYFSYKTAFSVATLTAAEPSVPGVFNVLFEISLGWFTANMLGKSLPNLGTAHSDEIPLLFKILVLPIYQNHKDYAMSVSLVKLFATFATVKPADPVMYKNIKWAPVNPAANPLPYLQLDDSSKIIDEPFTASVEFWKNRELSYNISLCT